MKKLFVCAMALAAFVSCSKEDIGGPALDSQNKSISITILNGSGATRADGGITAPGAGAVVDGQQTNKMASASASQLKVLFANSSGEILKVLPLVNTGSATDTSHDPNHAAEYVPGTTNEQDSYIWHNVPWAVTQIAVARYEAGDITIVEKAEGVTATNLSAVAALATDENLNIARELQTIVLYGVDTALEDLNQTHEVDGISYHYWKASVIVAPQLARFEVNNIQCIDLGYLNTDGDNRTYGFDELVANSLTWVTDGTVEEPAASAKEYTAKMAEGATTLGTMYGLYNNTSAANNTKKEGTRDNFINAGANKVWSWNVAANTTFDSMTVDLTALAYDYTLDENGQSVPLYITGLNNSTDKFTFQAGNIYQMNLQFVEGNVKDQDQLCVEVVVTVNPWTINTVTPVFGQNGSSTIPQQ